MINIEEIARTIVGLKTYESKINSQKMQLYKQFMDSHNDPGINIYRFIIAVLLISINIYGKSIKNDY